MRLIRIFSLILLFLGSSISFNAQYAADKADKNEAAGPDWSKNQCSDTNPFGYDHSSSGQVAWCGTCGSGLRQAPINIPTGIRESVQAPVEFLGYGQLTNLVVYNNAYNLKIDYKKGGGPAAIKIGNDIFKLSEFHFHRPSEEAVENHRFPMVLHLVHTKDGCEVGDVGCAAAVAILIEQATPQDPVKDETNRLLKILFQNFPPPVGEKEGVKITLEGLLPRDYKDAGYYRYDGSLTTPPCTENVTFYLLKPRLRFSAEQIEEFERRYPSPNARDIQPLNRREIKNRPQPPQP